jgi:hypothetical protein
MPNERSIIASGETVAFDRTPFKRERAARIRRRGKGALYPLDTALERPLSTFPDTQNAPSVEQPRVRRLLASSRDGRFSDWLPMKTVYRHTENGK